MTLMKIIQDLFEWRSLRSALPTDERIGFVPTMGNLHIGHAALIETSMQQCSKTLVSLFVNPTQFNQPADYTHYPRTLEADLERLQHLGVDYCLIPDENAMYVDGYQYQIQETALSTRLEGLYRPNHFTGVLTVVMKLLQLVRPHHVYFGEKDYQQYELIRGMIDAFFIDTQIHVCPTVREASGLAYSSRNNRLSCEEKKQAETFAQIFHTEKTCAAIQAALSKAGIAWDYIEDAGNRRYAAVHIGTVRLIDNYQIPASHLLCDASHIE